MKILLTIHEAFDPSSGSAGSVFRLGQQYENLGHQVYYYSYDDLPQSIRGVAKSIVFPGFVANRIAQLTRQQAIDVADTSTRDAWIWGSGWHRFAPDRPLLVTRSHGLEHMEHLAYLEDAQAGRLQLSWKYPLYRGSFYLWEAATSLRCADLAFLLNRQDANYAVQHLGVNSEQVHIFPNGIPDRFLNLPLEPTPLAKDAAIRIAQVSTYIPRKGIEYSAPAINSILRRYPQVEMTFLGTACLECPDVAQVYADFDPTVRDRITVIPRFQHDHLPELLKGYHIKLFPTLSEGFGKALVEAMACGLAPITTSTPGPLEIVRAEQDAIVIPPRDSQAIEQALERLVSDRPYLDYLRRHAYAKAQRYSWRCIAQARLACYETALHLKKNKLGMTIE